MKNKTKKKHSVMSVSSKTITFKNNDTGEIFSRPLNLSEKVMLEMADEAREKRSKEIHKVWFMIINEFTDGKGNFKSSGIELMEKLEEFYNKLSEEDKEQIDIISCDDDFHMSSILVFIKHQNQEEYWGTTVFFIGQREHTAHFFLYPSHHKMMLECLKRIDKDCRKKKKKKLVDSEPIWNSEP